MRQYLSAGEHFWRGNAPDRIIVVAQTLGFQSMKTAYATIKGFEVMRMFRKGQFRLWIEAVGGGTEALFINRLFGLYA